MDRVADSHRHIYSFLPHSRKDSGLKLTSCASLSLPPLRLTDLQWSKLYVSHFITSRLALHWLSLTNANVSYTSSFLTQQSRLSKQQQRDRLQGKTMKTTTTGSWRRYVFRCAATLTFVIHTFILLSHMRGIVWKASLTNPPPFVYNSGRSHETGSEEQGGRHWAFQRRQLQTCSCQIPQGTHTLRLVTSSSDAPGLASDTHLNPCYPNAHLDFILFNATIYTLHHIVYALHLFVFYLHDLAMILSYI